jgi:hypothetical protein
MTAVDEDTSSDLLLPRTPSNTPFVTTVPASPDENLTGVISSCICALKTLVVFEHHPVAVNVYTTKHGSLLFRKLLVAILFGAAFPIWKSGPTKNIVYALETGDVEVATRVLQDFIHDDGPRSAHFPENAVEFVQHCVDILAVVYAYSTVALYGLMSNSAHASRVAMLDGHRIARQAAPTLPKSIPVCPGGLRGTVQTPHVHPSL